MITDPQAVTDGTVRSDWRFKAAQGVVILKVFAAVDFFDPRAFDTFTLPKSAVSHGLSYILAALLGWLALRYGRRLFVWSTLYLFVGAVVLAFALATLFALDRTVALFGASRRYLGLTQMLDNALLFVAASVLFRTTRDAGRLLAGTLVATIPVLAYAMAQRAGLDPVAYKEGSTLLAISTFGHHDLTGAFMSIVGGTSVAVAILGGRGLPPWARAVLLVAAVVTVLALFITSVRNGVFGLAGAWVAMLAIIWFGRRSAMLAATAALIGVVVSVGVLLSPIAPRLAPASLRTDPAVLGRAEIWESAWKLVASHPILGVGPDNFAVGYESVHASWSVGVLGLGVLQTSTHNWFLYAATSAGLLGAGAMVLLLAFGIATGVGLARARQPLAIVLVPLVAFIAQGYVDVSDVGLEWILWVSLGILAGASGRPIGVGVQRPRTRALDPRLVTVVGSAALVAAMLGSATVVPRVQASELMNTAEGLVTAGRADLAGPVAIGATERDERRPEYSSALGSAYLAAGRAAPASLYLGNAARRATWHAQYWRNLAIADLALGNDGMAIAALKRSVQSDPYDPVSLDLLARAMYAKGDWQRAAEYGALSVQVWPNTPTGYETPIRAYMELGRFDTAQQIAEASIRNLPSQPLPYVLLAEVYANSGRIAAALVELDRALAIRPGFEPALTLQKRIKSR